VYVRVYSGKIQAGAQVLNARTGRKDRAQKLFVMHANDRESVPVAEAGEIVAVVGFRETSTGDTVSDPAHAIALDPPLFPETVISMAIEPETTADRDKLIETLEKIAREDPTFRWRADRETGQLIVSGMGELHLEVVRERLEWEFKVKATVGTPRVAYRQTILAAAQGEGVFEKRLADRNQFASVVLRLEPDASLARPRVVNDLRKEKVPLEFHPAIVDAAQAALESGGTLGMPLIQLRVRVLDACFRPGESTPVAYAAATSAAFDAALDEAQPVVLEPLMGFEVVTPDDYYGPVSTDLSRRRSSIEAVEIDQGLRVVRGVVPLAEVFGYSGTLRSLTQGRGTLSLEPHSYAPVPEDVARRFRF
jgi:elongation factor G